LGGWVAPDTGESGLRQRGRFLFEMLYPGFTSGVNFWRPYGTGTHEPCRATESADSETDDGESDRCAHAAMHVLTIADFGDG